MGKLLFKAIAAGLACFAVVAFIVYSFGVFFVIDDTLSITVHIVVAIIILIAVIKLFLYSKKHNWALLDKILDNLQTITFFVFLVGIILINIKTGFLYGTNSGNAYWVSYVSVFVMAVSELLLQGAKIY